MKTSRYITAISAAAAAILTISCSREPIAGAGCEGDVTILPRITGFTSKDVSSKANKNNAEGLVTNMMMIIFDSNGNLVQGNGVANPQYSEGSDIIFSIIRDQFPDAVQANLQQAQVHIIANIPDAASKDAFMAVQNITQLNAIDLPVESTIGIPQKGFPMTGAQVIDLRKSGGTTGVKQISIKALYSKIYFNIQVNPIQVNPDVTQRFQLTKWTVHNIPEKVRVGRPADNDPTPWSGAFCSFQDFESSDYTGANPVYGASSLEFAFYMPEHKVPTNSSNPYPSGIDEQSKQKYKPVKFDEGYSPAYVVIEGDYYDRTGTRKAVKYSVYLGENNCDNFHVLRDCQYNNYITIQGISNTTEGAGVSLDHRVDSHHSFYKFGLERETLLDAHWEIRPIRLRLDAHEYPGSRVVIELVNPTVDTWLRMEMPANPGGSDYCNVGENDLAYGKRKYFTTDLVTNTLSGGTSFTINADESKSDYTIWTYIDEYTATSGPETRSAGLRCSFYESSESVAPLVTETYTFIQRRVFPVSNEGRNYNIEYYEEYLYNYDGNEGYDVTTDGMAWGLDGEQLSNSVQAIYVDGSLSDDVATGIVRSYFDALYDFYNTYEEASSGRLDYFPYMGKKFTKDIAATVGITVLQTNGTPQSAVEYCLNKNKRNADGSLSSDSHWYLPAIDEIEDICMGGYSEFEVFQDKMYWSSQPAYTVDSLSWTSLGKQHLGNFYMDNVNNARATKVKANGKGGFTTVGSYMRKAETLYSFRLATSGYSTSPTGLTAVYGEGYNPRSAINRIRCVYHDSNEAFSTSQTFESGLYEGAWKSLDGITRSNASSHGGSYCALTNTGRETLIAQTSFKVDNPQAVSFWVNKPSGSDAGYWYVQVSSDGSNWTTVQQFNSNVSGWTQYTCNLASQSNVYVRIRHYFNEKSGWFPSYSDRRYIDDIVLTYEY